MKALIIGGTGVISSYIVDRLVEKNWEVSVINRGNKKIRKEVRSIVCDINNEEEVLKAIKGEYFDSVSDFTTMKESDVERNYRLFNNRTSQYILISSASVYSKPIASLPITEGSSIGNKYWLYSRNKIKCEEYLMDKFRNNDFPLTIVRPSHTYCERSIPLGFKGKNGPWQVCKRMLENKPVIVPGDGTSLWTVTHSKDFATGFVGLMGNTHSYGEAFNVVGDEVLSWNEIYKSVANALGVSLNPYYVSSSFLSSVSKSVGYDTEGTLLGDKANSAIFDNSKLKRVVPEMNTTVLFHEGIKESIEYFLSHDECRKEDKEFDLFSDSIINALKVAEEKVIKDFS